MKTKTAKATGYMRGLLLATITGSLAWHIVAMLLFSSVFAIRIQPEADIPYVRPIVMRHVGGLGAMSGDVNVQNMLKSLKIALPVKEFVTSIEYIPAQGEGESLGVDMPDLVARENLGTGLGLLRDLPGVSPRDISAEREPYKLEGSGVAIEMSGKRKAVFFPDPPAYPKDCEEKGIEGDVVLTFVVDTAGNVTTTRMIQLSGSSLLDQAAVDYIRKFKFEQSTVATNGSISLKFRFKTEKP